MRDDVQTFINTIEEVDGEKAITYSPQTVSIYENLVDEEYDEFIDAVTNEEKLDGAMDLIWVVLGYCNARGWNVEGAWEEVRRTNMAKLQVDPVTGHLKRRSDGKIMKPEGWTGPNLTPFVNVGK
jgi:predicted HAD superfamily Cof-like phosphohydrolase